MATSDPTHDFGSTGAARAVRVRAYSDVVTDARLAAMPTGSLALVLGFVAGSDDARSTPGRICALCDELIRRGVYAEILSALDPELAQRIDLLYTADRGQRWARRGHR